MKTLLIIFLTVYSTVATLPDDVVEQEWENFKRSHWNRGVDIHEHLRKGIFRKNLETIYSHNERYEKGLETYEMGVNSLTDKTEEELAAYTGLDASLEETEFLINITETEESPLLFKVGIPASLDWRSKGIVTPVKNQKQCGSCWAFAAIGALEAQYKLRRKATVILSEQQLVDCVAGSSCNGGNSGSAYSYIARNGINYNNIYPYEARNNRCRYNRNKPRVTIKGYGIATRNNEEKLRQAVATKGPVVVYIHVDNTFHNYRSGVYYHAGCSKRTNHAVVVVGYGRENGHDYWLVKNSWGAQWGQKGYVKMARNRGNNCAIASTGLYPIL